MERTSIKDITANDAHTEGPIARTIENQTAKLPSDTFLWAAVASIGASAILQFTNRKQLSNFVGQWAPTFLILGLYNKLVKVAGSDREEGGMDQGMERDQKTSMEHDSSSFKAA